mgnify:FL=1
MQGAIFFLWEPACSFGVSVADGNHLSRDLLPATQRMLSFHVVTRGPCWATVHGEAPLRLDTGDTLVLPRGDAYRIGDAPEFPTAEEQAGSIDLLTAISQMESPRVVRDDDSDSGRDGGNQLICGFLGSDALRGHPLLDGLPAMMRVPPPQTEPDPLSSLISIALAESGGTQGGERCLLMRLSEVMFIEILRRYLRSEAARDTAWLQGLSDLLVGRALGLLHANVAYPWTIESLARAAGSSRSTLAERFSAIVGVPPMHYLGQWRIQVAANRLRQPGARVNRVALDVGYASESSFSRAFRRQLGVSPGAWRVGG